MKSFKPINSSRRNLLLSDRGLLWKKKPLKSLVTFCNSNGGRNNYGRITVQGKSKGVKKLYRLIDFKRFKKIKTIVLRIEYDPNRSCYIALTKNNNELFYIIAPQNIKINSILESSEKTRINTGNSMQLKYVPLGCQIHNVEFKPGKGGQIARSAGSSCTIISKNKSTLLVKMCSGEIRIINLFCRATIGVISNIDNKNVKYGKAGRRALLGFKPKVRGVAKNPVDHPHGGGEGKASSGRHPVNFKGKLTKGAKTRSNKRTGRFIIKSRK